MGAARTVLNAKRLYAVAQFGQCRRRRSPGKASTNDYDLVLALVVGSNQLDFVFVPLPLQGERTIWNARVEVHVISPCRLELPPE